MTMPVYIVLDTNAWIFGTRLLRAPLAIALLHTAKRFDGLLLLPEVVEKEIRAVFRRECGRHMTSSNKSIAELETLVGRRFPRVPFPEPQDLEHAIDARFKELSPLLRRSELTLDHTRRALNRVIDRIPPASRDEQFRDAMIWEAVATVAADHETYFITADKAFYHNRDYQAGLAAELATGLHRLKVGPTLEVYLNSYPSADATDDDGWEEIIENAVRRELEYTPDQYVSVLSCLKADFDPFLTDNPGFIAFRFDFEFEVLYGPDMDDEAEKTTLTIAGEALVNTTQGRLDEIRLSHGRLKDKPVVYWSEMENPSSAAMYRDLPTKRFLTPGSKS